MAFLDTVDLTFSASSVYFSDIVKGKKLVKFEEPDKEE
jgi:hypothetical protein